MDGGSITHQAAKTENETFIFMAIRLEKGQRINLEKGTGARLTNFCVGCNWGAIVKKTFFGLGSKIVDVDLDSLVSIKICSF